MNLRKKLTLYREEVVELLLRGSMLLYLPHCDLFDSRCWHLEQEGRVIVCVANDIRLGPLGLFLLELTRKRRLLSLLRHLVDLHHNLNLINCWLS